MLKPTVITPEALSSLLATVDQESAGILRWWAKNLPDPERSGFFGEVDNTGHAVADAPRGVILNTRLLWYFAEAALHFGADSALGFEAKALADRAYAELNGPFLDAQNDGLYWLVAPDGAPLDTRKQGYAQAFGIYALSAYYRLTQNAEALGFAHRLLAELETRFWDPVHGGYIEALSADWRPVADQRLSDKDADCPKTMNTHLHILEAYTGLHLAAPDARSEAALRRIISVFLEYFIDADTGHLKLFFAMDWCDHTNAVSFGHDIEASWLIWEAARVLGDEDILARIRPIVLKLAEVTLAEGLRPDGGIMYERGFDGHLDAYGEWWGQAEAMVGFLNAYQLAPDPAYLTVLEGLMAYTAREHKRAPEAEWTWYPRADGRASPYLAGLWKCPYHNGRAMFELHDRLSQMRI